jgi:hypothetical protein
MGNVSREDTAAMVYHTRRNKFLSRSIKAPDIDVQFTDWIERDPNKTGKIKLAQSDIPDRT